MTRKENTHHRSLDFSGWIRSNLKDSFNGLIAQDIDWIFVNYCTGYFIVLEEKTNRYKGSKYTSPAQTVIFKMLNDLLELGSEANKITKKAFNPATKKIYSFQGSFILEFINGTDPNNSTNIYLNGKEISRNDLIRLLNLGKDSIDILNRYKNNWIEENLSKQINSLTGNCDE